MLFQTCLFGCIHPNPSPSLGSAELFWHLSLWPEGAHHLSSWNILCFHCVNITLLIFVFFYLLASHKHTQLLLVWRLSCSIHTWKLSGIMTKIYLNEQIQLLHTQSYKIPIKPELDCKCERGYRHIFCCHCLYSQHNYIRLTVAAEASSVFQMATVGAGTGGNSIQGTTMTNQSQKNWPACLWHSLTMTPFPCHPIWMLLLRSCHSRKDRSSRWGLQ